ncbi:MAG: MFS transporter [Acidiferrobacteraceae bacterium]
MKKNVLLLAACQALMMTANSLLVTTTALVGYRLAADKALATLPMAMQMLATMMTTIPASLLMKRIGRRSGFLVGAIIGLFGAVLATVAVLDHQFLLYITGAALIGSFNGFGNYYRFAAADTATDDWRSRAVSFVMAGGVIAALAGPNLARYTAHLIPEAVYAGSIGSTIVLYLASLFLLSLVRIPPEPGEVHGTMRRLGEIARQPLYLAALVGGAAGYGAMVLIMTATPLAMHRYAYSFSDTAFVIQWHVLGMFAPSFVTGYLIARFGALNIIMTGALLILACVAANLTGTAMAHFWVALLLLGTGWNFMFIGATTLLTVTYAPAEKAKSQALNDFTVFTIVTLASLSSGALLQFVGWRMVNLAVIPLMLLALVVTAWQRLKSSPTSIRGF